MRKPIINPEQTRPFGIVLSEKRIIELEEAARAETYSSEHGKVTSSDIARKAIEAYLQNHPERHRIQTETEIRLQYELDRANRLPYAE